MVEVPGDTHTITCTRLALLNGSHIFLRTKWFNTSFSVTALDFPRSWSCHVAKPEVEEIASMLGINGEEFFSQARLYLGDSISEARYSFVALARPPNVMRLSWTTTDTRYNEEPRVALFFQEDKSTMEHVPVFLNVLMDTTLILKMKRPCSEAIARQRKPVGCLVLDLSLVGPCGAIEHLVGHGRLEIECERANLSMTTVRMPRCIQDLLARRKLNKSKKVRQLAMRFSASEKIRRRSLSQQAPSREGMRLGLNGLVVKSEFPNGTPKFNSPPVSYEPASGRSTPTHPPSLTALDGRAQQQDLRTPAVENSKPPRQVLQSVSSTSKSLNLGMYNAGRLVLEAEAMPCYGHQASALYFDRPNGLGNYVGVSHGQLSSLPSGYRNISESMREQAQVGVQRLRALEQRGEAVQVSMTNDHDYILDRVGSSQLKLPVTVDVYDGLDGVPSAKHSPEFAPRLFEHGQLSSWASPRTVIRTTTAVDVGSTSRPSPTFHDVAVPKNFHKTPAGDKNALPHESRKLGVANSDGNGWINPRKSSTSRVDSRGFAGSTRRSASQGRESIIMLSDSEEEGYRNIEVDPGVLDDSDLLDRRMPPAMEGLSDEPDGRFTIRAGRLNDPLPYPWRGNIGLLNMNVSKAMDERIRSRLEPDAQASLDWPGRSRKRKGRDDAREDRTDIFVEEKRAQTNGFLTEEQGLSSRGSLSRNRSGLDAQAFVPASTAPYVKVEGEYQPQQNAVWQSGTHRNEKHFNTFNFGNRALWKPAYHATDNRNEKLSSTFNYENRWARAQWNTWISEAKTEVTSWEAQIQAVNSAAAGSGHVGDYFTENVLYTSSPCDSKHLDTPLSMRKLDRHFDGVDFPHSGSEHFRSPREVLNTTFPRSEENSGRERLESLAGSLAENPERSYTREMDSSKKGVSCDVPQFEKVKVEREFIDVENDGDSDSVEEHVFEPGLNNDNEGMPGAGDTIALKIRERENSASIRPLEEGALARKLPGRRGRPPGTGTKGQSNSKPTKSVSQGVNTCTDGTTQSDRDPGKSTSSRLPRTARPVGRPKHSNSQGHPPAVFYEVKKSMVDVDQDLQKSVPDSDYYCFDSDRGREKIRPNQIWALYDDFDTMPRTLIRVKEVSTNGAFWVKACWLQPHLASKKHDRQKTLSGYPRSCGDFEEPRETTIIRVLNCFSHMMEFAPKFDTVIQVYPRIGEVWALHKLKDSKPARSEKEKSAKGDVEENGNFRLVVVLSNCEEGRSSEILVLRKRTGYRTLWEPGYEKGELPQGNMERFSHRVPAYKLTEKDYPDLNNSDIWDIDAAAVPTCQSKVT